MGGKADSGKINRMSFGKAPNELMAGAKNAIEVCLNVRAGESLALIADENEAPNREPPPVDDPLVTPAAAAE